MVMTIPQRINGSATAGSATPFARLPPDARSHFLLHFYAATQRLITYARRLDQAAAVPADRVLAEHPFLVGYHNEIRAVLPADMDDVDVPAWWEQTIGAWEVAVVERLPLREAAQLGVGFAGRLAILLAGMADTDSRLGTLFAQIQAPLSQRRPSLETIGQILASGWSSGLAAGEVCRELLRCGLLELVNPDAPRAEWVLIC
jgi:hypothetical protein